jgi:hypothetical protein
MKRWHLLTVTAIFVLLVLLSDIALGQGGYDLSWWTVDGGGGDSKGGVYALGGTAGQPDVGPALSGGVYTLVGGFWGGAVAESHSIYLPLVLKNL